MTSSPAPVAALGLALLAIWWLTRRADGFVSQAEGEASQEPEPDPFGLDLADTWTQATDYMRPINTDQADANTAAFLGMIRTAEGTADALGYQALFGHRANRPRTFSSWADHPRIAQQFTTGDGRRLWTSAAGAYQFMAKSPIPGGGSTSVNTWDVLQKRLGLPDFSPASQDLAAIELIREAGALGDVRAGRFEQAVTKVRRIWASLPGAGYGQGERSLESLRLAYLNNGGTLA
jgi:muramidase (phage lysozyme)